MVRKSSSVRRHRGGSLASDRVMSNLQSAPCQTHNNLSVPQVEGNPENLNLYQIQSGGSLASDAVMKGLDNPPCCYASAFEGTGCQHGGKRRRRNRRSKKSKRTSKRRTASKSKQAGGKKRKHRHSSKCKHSSKKQAGGKKRRSRKSKKRSRKSRHSGGGSSDWGHSNYSLKVGVPDAGEAARFKHFTEAKFQSPSQLYAEPNNVDHPPYAPYDPTSKLEGVVSK